VKTKVALKGIVNDARGWLRGWADGFTDKEARDSKKSTANPLAWQLAHVACTQDDVIRLFSADGKGVTPDALRKAFGNGAPPPTNRTKYPPLKTLWRLLDRTQARLLKMIDRATPKDLLKKPNEPSDFFTSFGQGVYEISLHETYHVGQVATLRKAHKKPPIA
jgi:hypothetical protein